MPNKLPFLTKPYSREKLCPVLGLYIEEDWKAACHRVVELLTNEGLGHTLVIHTRNRDVIRQFCLGNRLTAF